MPAITVPSPQSVYNGNYASVPASTLKPPVEGNRTIPVIINWLSAGVSPGYTIYFNARLQQTLAINQIAALHIDNSHNHSSMHVAFIDTQFEVIVGPNQVGFYPIITNSLEFYAWVDLVPQAQDQTIIQVLNFLPPPILFGAQPGGSGVGTVTEVDTAAPLTGGPITAQGTVALQTPLAINYGGTGATSGNGAFDALSGSSGTLTGTLTRTSAGIWEITSAGSGTITGVTAGNGMQGGGTSGTVSLGINPPVSISNGGTGSTTAAGALTALGAAPTASPALTGSPTVPNVTPASTSNTVAANTAFVHAAIANDIPLPLSTAQGGTGAVTPAAALTNLGAAPIASPTFTGTPQAPNPALTPSLGTQQLATTEFVRTGVTDGSNPVAGQVGEVLSASSGTPVSITTDNVWQSVFTMALTPGDWDVHAMGFLVTPGTSATNFGFSLNITGETLGANVTFTANIVSGTTISINNVSLPTPMRRVNISSATTVILAAICNNPGQTKAVDSMAIYARRMR
jgi:hypothetical protein